MNKRYADMLDLPHHVSSRHPPMPMAERAAQFSPFAALSGYEDVIQETGRLTQEPAELDESRQEALNECLKALALAQRPEVTVTYFRPDERKSGGAYVRVTGRVHKIDALQGLLQLEDGTSIPFELLYALSSEVLREEET